jgi:hypothetical protein
MFSIGEFARLGTVSVRRVFEVQLPFTRPEPPPA